MKKIAILQSNYIPWKGYFDLINMVDEFVFYDEVQYTKNDWRNRNKIKTKTGLQWLTIPVRQESLTQTITQTKVVDHRWSIKHWRAITQSYSKSIFFSMYETLFNDLYLSCDNESLSEINYKFIIAINNILGVKTKIRWSNEFDLGDGQTEKLLSICKACNANVYLSGPAAKNYFNEELARRENIEVEWMNYSLYPEYEQLHPPFAHEVSILDLIFNKGPDAKNYMKSFK